MAIPRTDIKLSDPQYNGLNIGGVIKKNLDLVDSLNINSVTLEVDNHYIWGNFDVPSAIGFSTPLHPIASGGTLCFGWLIDMTDENVFLKRFHEWDSIYRKRPVTKPD